MSLPLLPGLSGLVRRHQEVVPTNGLESDLREAEEDIDEEELNALLSYADYMREIADAEAKEAARDEEIELRKLTNQERLGFEFLKQLHLGFEEEAKKAARDEEIELHEPTKQEMLQYEIMRLALDSKYRPQHPGFDNNTNTIRSVVLTRIRQDGMALEYASEELKKDREVVMAAVVEDGGALQYASEELKNNESVMLAAVYKDGLLLRYASEELKNNWSVVYSAFKQNREALQYASPELRNSDRMRYELKGRPLFG